MRNYYNLCAGGLQRIFLFSGLIFGYSLSGQTFSKEITNNTLLEAHHYQFEATASQIISGLTEVDATDFRKQISLLFYDHDGNILNSFRYASPDSNASLSFRYVLSLNSGDLLISGKYAPGNGQLESPFLMLTDSTGNITWSKVLDKPSGHAPYIAELSDDTILVAVNNATRYTLFRLTTSGHTSSFREIFMGSTLHRILPRSGSFELLANNGKFLNIENDLSTVNLQRKYYSEIGITFDTASNGDYLFASAQVSFPGHTTVFRTDEQGNLIWAKYIETWEKANMPSTSAFDVVGYNFIKETPDGNITVSANSEGGMNGSLQLLLDGNGNYIDNYKTTTVKNKTKMIGDEQYLIGGHTAPGGFNTSDFVMEKRNVAEAFPCDTTYYYSIVTGDDMAQTPDNDTLTSVSSINLNDIAVIKTPSVISQGDFCDLTLHHESEITARPAALAFPNPSSGIVEIKTSGDLGKTDVYDVHGRQILSTTRTPIDLSAFPAGLYILHIETGNSLLREKIIKN